MTAKRAERITKLEIRCLHNGPRVFKYGAFEVGGKDPLVEAQAPNPHEAVSKLVEANYYRVRMVVFDRALWRCEQCGRIKPLQFDHIIPRSKGRVDTAENGRAVCAECHKEKHG